MRGRGGLEKRDEDRCGCDQKLLLEWRRIRGGEQGAERREKGSEGRGGKENGGEVLLEEMEKIELQTGREVAAGEGMQGEVEEGKREVLAAARGIARGEIVEEGLKVLC